MVVSTQQISSNFNLFAIVILISVVSKYQNIFEESFLTFTLWRYVYLQYHKQLTHFMTKKSNVHVSYIQKSEKNTADLPRSLVWASRSPLFAEEVL